MRVVCVLRSGGVYTPEYVRRLAAGVGQWSNSPEPVLTCLSDVDLKLPGVKSVPLVTRWPGWLAKLELFRPGLFKPYEQVLYLDLDTVVVGDLTPLLTLHTRFAMLSDFLRPEYAASGVMSFRGDWSGIYERFNDDLVPLYDSWHPERRGDGGWIQSALMTMGYIPDRLQDLLPGAVSSRKVKRGPRGQSLVCFHGKPRPHEVGWRVP